ncbi:MAG: hypothetical protein IJJ69_08340 [Oscillospiraceae bacterium]|nr:hypothetical protein [Oscillospiraceae bacterium]
MKNYFILYSIFTPEKIKQILFEPLENTRKLSSEGYPIYGKIPKFWLCFFQFHVKSTSKGTKIKVTVKFRKEIQILDKIFLMYNVTVLFLCIGYYADMIPYSILRPFLYAFFIFFALDLLLHLQKMSRLQKVKKIIEPFLHEKEQEFLTQSKQHENADKIL